MAAYATYSREAADASLNGQEKNTSGSDHPRSDLTSPRSTQGRPKKSCKGKGTQWKPLDLDAEPPSVDAHIASGWGAPPEESAPPSSPLNAPRRPKNPGRRQNKKGRPSPATPADRSPPNPQVSQEPAQDQPFKALRRRSPAMIAVTGKERKSVPPHLRNRTPKPSKVSVPPHRRKPITPESQRTEGQTQDNGVRLSPQAGAGESPDSHVLPHTTAANGVSMTTPPSPPDSSIEFKKISTTPATGSLGQGSDIKRQPSPENGQADRSRTFHRPNWVRGNNPNQNPKPRRSAWLKTKDLKPRREDLDSDGGIEVDDGWEEWQKNHKDHIPGQLFDWKGDWLPAPVEWAERHQYTHPSLEKFWDAWAQQMELVYAKEARARGDDTKTPQRIDSITLYKAPYTENWIEGDFDKRKEKNELLLLTHWKPDFTLRADPVAIKEWIPKVIEGDSPRNFWNTLPMRAPDTVSDIGLDEHPWWDLAHGTHCLLPAPEAPEARCNPEDEGCKLPGYKMTALEAIRRKELATELRIRKIQEKRNRAVAVAVAPVAVLPAENALKPTANIYVRPVTAADVGAITGIYNHYVKHTVAANEFTERTSDMMRTRIRETTSDGLPYIVAVQRNQKKSRGNFNGPNIIENVVGFASINDFCDPSSMYRYTFEMEMFVNHQFLHQGIGKCLLDRMLALVDPGYASRGGYDWLPREEYLRTGCTRVVKVLTVNLPHANNPEEKAKVEHVTKFLKEFKFRKAGNFHNAGYKLGKCVDLSIFQYSTDESINAGMNPMMLM